MFQYWGKYVLIVPLWNWNSIPTYWRGPEPSSNCTFMELKWILLAVLTILLVRSNCTFMELKCPYSPIRCCESSCSNCTFMELKYVKQRRSVWSEIVLIVPLWNWNNYGYNSYKDVESSNCTFMELKFSLSRRCTEHTMF